MKKARKDSAGKKVLQQLYCYKRYDKPYSVTASMYASMARAARDRDVAVQRAYI